MSFVGAPATAAGKLYGFFTSLYNLLQAGYPPDLYLEVRVQGQMDQDIQQAITIMELAEKGCSLLRIGSAMNQIAATVTGRTQHDQGLGHAPQIGQAFKNGQALAMVG